jgi:hypothetical protein
MSIMRKHIYIHTARGAYNQPCEALNRGVASIFLRDYACRGCSFFEGWGVG